MRVGNSLMLLAELDKLTAAEGSQIMMSSSLVALLGAALNDIEVEKQPDSGTKPEKSNLLTVISASATSDIDAGKLFHTDFDATTPSSPLSNVTSLIPGTLLNNTAPATSSSAASSSTESVSSSSSALSAVQTSTRLSSQSQAAVAYNTAVNRLFFGKVINEANMPLHDYLVSSHPLPKTLLAPGDILWFNAVPFGLDKTLLNCLSSADPCETPRMSNHPCVVFDVLPGDVDEVKICLVRTFGGKNPRKLRKIKGNDQAYICTIDHPEGHEAQPSIVFKHQNPKAAMPKPSYVDTRSLHVYTVSTTLLKKVTPDLPLKHYSLDYQSTEALKTIVARSERIMEEGEWRIRQQERQVHERALDIEIQHLLYVEDTKKHHPISVFCEDWCKKHSRDVGKTAYRDCWNCMNHLNVERFRGLDCHIKECPCPKSSRS